MPNTVGHGTSSGKGGKAFSKGGKVGKRFSTPRKGKMGSVKVGKGKQEVPGRANHSIILCNLALDFGELLGLFPNRDLGLRVVEVNFARVSLVLLPHALRHESLWWVARTVQAKRKWTR